jgi:hypothetical protein
MALGTPHVPHSVAGQVDVAKHLTRGVGREDHDSGELTDPDGHEGPVALGEAHGGAVWCTPLHRVEGFNEPKCPGATGGCLQCVGGSG